MFSRSFEIHVNYDWLLLISMYYTLEMYIYAHQVYISTIKFKIPVSGHQEIYTYNHKLLFYLFLSRKNTKDFSRAHSKNEPVI